MGVEPALAAAAVGAGGDPLGRQPGEAAGERVGVLEHDVGAFGQLRLMVGLEDRQAALAGQDQIAALAKADVGIGTELLLEPPEQLQRELRQPDVLRDRELLPDGGAGQGGRRMSELRVALDQRNGAGKPFLAQVIGDGRSDDGSADDDDVVAHASRPFHSQSMIPRAGHRIRKRSCGNTITRPAR
jgi:hypothetical protein